MPEPREHNQDDGYTDARLRRREVVDVLTEALWTLLCRGDAQEVVGQCSPQTSSDATKAEIGNDATR